ncbi:antiviral reverse transcriptase Drt3b [Caballeronia sp. ATUFL_M1_KS5A]|uniref:antiviral reverse transcriptase Drt3b n=1 Tax=Caballeronia sp. ATUFL_M1_KS5A TaxID=2921778 RepID=UPI0020280D67|nr:antiviral reverse transcriptase Drt3b [Caballeronia sp. ATUFL_M1_KS5A]
MRKTSKAWLNRAIVTETLPYEVPVIFSNDKFFSSLVLRGSSRESQKIIDRIYEKAKAFTVPYNYAISKGRGRSTKLSIVHPLSQIAMSDFYLMHEGSLLSHCAKSSFSLRRPVAVASEYSESAAKNAPPAPKTGTVEGRADSDPSNFISYFVYEPFSLLGKFYESRQFIALEKRFRLMRTLDISKCFYHIYTHTISWAVKDRPFAKTHSNAYSFELEFDRLMQRANYNETNGIVVGPEMSRIFAEIILQKIDSDVEYDLSRQGLVRDQDYSIRRYVDDYAIFAPNEKTLDAAERVISSRLSEIKLYPNEKKIATYERPFVTPLTLAKVELSMIVKTFERVLFDEKGVRSSAVREVLRDIRAIIVKHGIDFENVSGWLMSTFSRLILMTNSRLGVTPDQEVVRTWSRIVSAILDLAFHVCALDLRVRTTYSVCQLINSLFKARNVVPEADFDEIAHKISEELSLALENQQRDGFEQESIETYNLALTGVVFLGGKFARQQVSRKLFKTLLESELTYFKFITLTFCFNSDPGFFATEIASLNQSVKSMLLGGAEFKKECEPFLFFCDYLSSPLVSDKDKRQVLKSVAGGNPSATILSEVSAMIGFAEWDGTSVDHLLRRKELRPVYAMT